jgi:hypothetical protein
MNAILEIILESVILILFRYPGAFIRWTFTLYRKPFKDILNDNEYLNGWLGLVAVSLIIIQVCKFFGWT